MTPMTILSVRPGHLQLAAYAVLKLLRCAAILNKQTRVEIFKGSRGYERETIG